MYGCEGADAANDEGLGARAGQQVFEEAKKAVRRTSSALRA